MFPFAVGLALGNTKLLKTIEIGQLGNVSLDASDIAADRLHGRIELSLTAARDENVGTLSYEELCGSEPDPGRATGNHPPSPLLSAAPKSGFRTIKQGSDHQTSAGR